MPLFDAAFSPIMLRNVTLPNRWAMAPMTRSKSPGRVPGPDVAAYYAARARGGAGLIITEGVTLADPRSSDDENVPALAPAASAGWKRVVDAVHFEGGRIFAQLWHVGGARDPAKSASPDLPSMSPSGLGPFGQHTGPPMTHAEIAATIEEYASSARLACEVGFDGVEIHAAHGYLIDQFFWPGTNLRTDGYGVSAPMGRQRFACELVAALRAAVGDRPIVLRWSQWKPHDFTAKIAQTPKELEAFLAPLAESGIDAFHCSTRRFWEPEFPNHPENLAGWTKKLTGKPAITVGSIGLAADFLTTMTTDHHADLALNQLESLEARLAAGEFDLAAVGRALIANPDWVELARRDDFAAMRPFDRNLLETLA